MRPGGTPEQSDAFGRDLKFCRVLFDPANGAFDIADRRQIIRLREPVINIKNGKTLRGKKAVPLRKIVSLARAPRTAVNDNQTRAVICGILGWQIDIQLQIFSVNLSKSVCRKIFYIISCAI